MLKDAFPTHVIVTLGRASVLPFLCPASASPCQPSLAFVLQPGLQPLGQRDVAAGRHLALLLTAHQYPQLCLLAPPPHPPILALLVQGDNHMGWEGHL